MNPPLTGGCLCGAVRYTVSVALEAVSACHCTHCRRISGAGCSHNAIFPSAALTYTAALPKRYIDTADSGNRLFRFFCPECGSSICSQREKVPEIVVLKVGTLDDASGLRLAREVWTDSALPWMRLDPAAEHHPRNRPSPMN